MLKNYFKIAFRNLKRKKFYTSINVAGLAIGMACCLLILLYVRNELSFDRFHENADRIVRLTTRFVISGAEQHYAEAAAPLASVMLEEFPEVEAATRIRSESAVVRQDDRVFQEDRFYFADSSVFDVFSLHLIRGEPTTALTDPYTIVLSETTARKYFGSENPIGRSLKAGEDEYMVTGVFADLPPQSHMHFDFLASMASLPESKLRGPTKWASTVNYYTYLLLRPGTSPEDLAQKLPALVDRNIGAMIQQFGVTYELFLQPLTRIHLHSKLLSEIEPTSSIAYVYIFGSVALFILLIACINFMNLATARSAERAKEVGVRKVFGAYRFQLIRQFLAESILLTSLALLLALVLANAALPLFNALTGRVLEIGFIDNAAMLALFGLVALLVGLIAGSYPAFFLSSFLPAQVLKGRFRRSDSGSGVWLRKGLVVTQFTVSMVLIIGTLVVSRQLDYVQNQSLGFDKEQVVMLPVYQDDRLSDRTETLKDEIGGLSTVTGVAASDHYPGGPRGDISLLPEGKSDNKAHNFWKYNAGFDFVETLGLELIAGRDFDPARAGDSAAVLINETAARMLGWENPVGRRILELTGTTAADRVPRRIIGVVRDFHFQSFRQEIRPLVIGIDSSPDYLLVRIQPGAIPHTLASLRQTWEKYAAGTPFQYTFLDEYFDEAYRAEEQLSRVFRYFTALALLIACLGLFGLAAYTAQRRTKEMGIRKVLGATVTNIIGLLSKDFLKLVAIGFIIAVPIAWYFMNRWLADFAYKIDIGIGIFLMAGGLALLIALATVSWQSIRAALANPVDSLRSE